MINEFEKETLRVQRSRIYLHARAHAVDFYLNSNYEVFGEPFEEVGIPHRHMQKFLKKQEEPPKIEDLIGHRNMGMFETVNSSEL